MTTFTQPAAGWINPPLDGVAGTLATAVIDAVKHAAANAPRSLQGEPGPSELGTPCIRRLAYRTVNWEPKPNSDTDPWAAIQGTAVHAWLADVFKADRSSRFLVEHRVHLPGDVSGSCDLYDRQIATVIDWKVVGPSRLRDCQKNGPGEQYRTQAHLYALGLQLQGEQPREVAIVFLPRGGRIDGLHVWAEPYDHTVAVAALHRYQAVIDFHDKVDPLSDPQRLSLLPTADAYCTYCPWFFPGSADLGQGCPGHNNTVKEK